MSSGGLKGLEHPTKVWHNSQLSSCVTTILTDKQQLVAKTNNKLTGLTLNGSFSSLLGLKQPSLSSSCVQECVNEGRGQRFGGVAKYFVRALLARLAQHLPSSNPGHAPDYNIAWCDLGMGTRLILLMGVAYLVVYSQFNASVEEIKRSTVLLINRSFLG